MSTENLNTDAERAEFEAAFESMFFSSCFEREADGSYAGRGLQCAWLGWQKARAAQPAPVVPEGYVLVPKSMWVDAASIEALAFVMGGPEEDDGSPTYCDCVMWVGEIDDDGVKRHGIHVYNTECEEEGSTTLAEFAAAPAQGQQDKCVHTEHCCSKHGCKYGDENCPVACGDKVQSFPCEECDEEAQGQQVDGGLIAHANLLRAQQAEAECERLRDKYQRDVYGLNNEGDPIGGEPAGGYANDNARLRAELSALKAQQGEGTTSDKYRAELYDEVWQLARDMGYGNVTMALNDLAAFKALKAQQEPVAWRVTGAGGLTVTPEYPKWAEDDSRLLIESLYTAPQPAPAQDVAGWIPVTERLPEVETDVLVRGVRRNEVMHRVAGLFNGEWSSQETEDLLLGEVTHWMPLPAAPAAHDKQSGVE